MPAASELSRDLLSRRSLLRLTLPSLPLAGLLAAQRTPTFTANVKVVLVFATVRDRRGQFISNLPKSEFTLLEDGRRQDIRYFSRESDLPLTLGLLIDTSLSQQEVLSKELRASYHFLDRVLREDRDKTFLIHFDRSVELLQDLTSSRQRLQAALTGHRRAPSGERPHWGENIPAGQAGITEDTGDDEFSGWDLRATAGGTALYDAVTLACDELMKWQQNRKALIVLSDGVDIGSRTPLAEAIDAAQDADSIIYTIQFSDPGYYGRHAPAAHVGGLGKRVLQRMSKETGGAYFEVSATEPIDKVYAQIEDELRSQYSLGYTSNQPTHNRVYRRITLLVKPKNLTVHTREGYYPAP